MASLPTGVEIRNKSICIWFMYRGKRCRELLKGWAITPGNLKKAGNLRAAIVSDITLGQFEYYARFPESRKKSQTGTAQLAATIGELFAIWLGVKETELTANTLKKTKSELQTLAHIINKDTVLSDIRHSDILNYRNTLLTGETLYLHNPRSNKVGRAVRTVNGYIALLCGVLRFAYQSGYIKHKPYEGVKKLQQNRVKPDPLLKSEFEQLMKSISGQRQNMWKFAIYSGLRHGELAALAWEDVDLDAGTVHVRRNLTNMRMFGPPKTTAGDRIVNLLAPALEALKAQYKFTGHIPTTEIVFHHREYGSTELQRVHFVFVPRIRKGEQKAHYSQSSIGARWNAAVKRAGIRRRNPYHTRHTFACWLLSAGANPAFIASQMGHEDAKMVYETYGTWIKELNGDQVRMLNAMLA